MAVSQTDRPERHLSTFEKQQPRKEEVTESSQTVVDHAIWQNSHGELSLQVTGDPPTDDVLPMWAQVRSWLCRCCASLCWSVRGSGLWGDQLGCRSVKPWRRQAVVSQVRGSRAAGCQPARLRGGQAAVGPLGLGSVCRCQAAGQPGCRAGGVPGGRARLPKQVPRTIAPSPSPGGSAGVTRGPRAPAPRRSCPCRRGSASRWAPPRSRRTPGT